MKITAIISTYKRRESLARVVAALLLQHRRPDKVAIYDDGEELPESVIAPLLRFGIDAELRCGRGSQVANFENARDSYPASLHWRLDDDTIPAADCLHQLATEWAVVESVTKFRSARIGAIGGPVVVSMQTLDTVPEYSCNKLGDEHLPQMQTFLNPTGGVCEVDHLVTSYLYDPAPTGYPLDLSRTGHTSETQHCLRLRALGYKLLYTPRAICYHTVETEGGTRELPEEDIVSDWAAYRKYVATL
jgi:hypothetical protein